VTGEIPEVLYWVAELAMADGAAPINRLPGCWARRVDDHWEIVVNGHDRPVEHGGVEVPPYTCVVKFDGWPAGVVDPAGGIVAAGEAANEEALIAALKRAVEEAKACRR
jgi:hypothetical protein